MPSSDMAWIYIQVLVVARIGLNSREIRVFRQKSTVYWKSQTSQRTDRDLYLSLLARRIII